MALKAKRKKINLVDFSFMSHNKEFVFLFPQLFSQRENFAFFIFFSFKQKKGEWMRNFLIYFSVQNIPDVLGWAWIWLDIRTFLFFIGYLTFFCQKAFRKRRKLTLSKFLKLLLIHEFCQLTLGYEKKKNLKFWNRKSIVIHEKNRLNFFFPWVSRIFCALNL